MPRRPPPKKAPTRASASDATTAAASLRLDPDDALLLRLFPTAAAALCTLPESARGRALAALREAIAARPKAPRGTTSADVHDASDLAEAAIEAGKAPRDREEAPQLPTLTAASAEDVCEFIKQWGRTDAATAPPPSSPDQRGWPSAQSKDGVLNLPPKPRRPQPLDMMPDARPGVETIADYRADVSNPVVSPWSLPLFEWSPRRRCCFTVVSFGVVDGTLRLVCSPLRVGPSSAAVCGPPIAVRCLFDATLHRSRCGAVPEALVGRHVTVWDPYLWIAADGLHEVQVDSAKDVAFHLTEAEVAHYSAMEEQDGGYALRWFRKGKADGDALVKQNEYAAALRAYVHGLCKCYTRGPLDQPSSCIDELFAVGVSVATAFGNLGECVTPEQLNALGLRSHAENATFRRGASAFAFGAQLLFTPEIGLSALHRIWPGFDVSDPSSVDTLVGSMVIGQAMGVHSGDVPSRRDVDDVLSAHSFPLLCSALQTFPLVAKYLGNVTLACRKLRLWSPCFTAGLVAAFMSPEADFTNKYRGYAAIAAANMGHILSNKVSGAYATRSQRMCDLFGTVGWVLPKADEVPDAPGKHVWGTHVEGINSAKGRGMFANCDIDDPEHRLSLSLPFASSTGADLASIHYRDWTVPRDFAGLFRVLQQQCAAPCADLFMQQLHFLDGRNDGEFRQSLPWCNEPVSTLKRTPLLFHDLSVPLKAHISTAIKPAEFCHVGQRALFDAARAIEVVGINALHAPKTSFQSGEAMLHIGVAMCNHSSLPNAGLSTLWPNSPHPVLTLQPLRPLHEGEEITLLYQDHPTGAAVFANRWGDAFHPPPELDGIYQMVMEAVQEGGFTRHTLRAMIIDFAKKQLKWSVDRCRKAHQAPFIDFMLDFFKDCDSPLLHLFHHLATHGDDVITAALPKDPRLAFLALKLGVPTSHFEDN